MAHIPYYDHANLTLRLPDFSNASKGRKRRRSRPMESDLLEVPRPDSARSNSSKTVTPGGGASTRPSPSPQRHQYTPMSTPHATPTSLSGPPSLRNSPPFDPSRTPTSSVFHVRVPSSSHRYHREEVSMPTHHDLPLQQPDTPILSPSDDVIFPPSSSAGLRSSSRITLGMLGHNLQFMGLGPDTPPVSPTPSPLVLSDSRVDSTSAGDYFSKHQATIDITPPNDNEADKATMGYFPGAKYSVATCASTVAGSLSMQRWLQE